MIGSAELFGCIFAFLCGLIGFLFTKQYGIFFAVTGTMASIVLGFILGIVYNKLTDKLNIVSDNYLKDGKKIISHFFTGIHILCAIFISFVLYWLFKELL